MAKTNKKNFDLAAGTAALEGRVALDILNSKAAPEVVEKQLSALGTGIQNKYSK